jgi:hypothetical protein
MKTQRTITSHVYNVRFVPLVSEGRAAEVWESSAKNKVSVASPMIFLF